MADQEVRKENGAELTAEELEGVQGGASGSLTMTDYVCLECGKSRRAYTAPLCCGKRMVKGRPEE